MGAKGRCNEDGCPETNDQCGNDSDCINGGYCEKGKCQSGEVGSRCGTDDDCIDGTYCEEGKCLAGADGDKCGNDDDCAMSGNYCEKNKCYDGSEGDKCGNDDDCAIGGNYCEEGEWDFPITKTELGNFTPTHVIAHFRGCRLTHGMVLALALLQRVASIEA